MTELNRQEVTVQLLHTALENIFLSIEEMPNCQLQDHLEPYVNQATLHRLLQERGLMDEPDIIRGKTRLVASTVFGNDFLDTRIQDRIVYGSNRELVETAFGDIFNRFIEDIESMLVAGCDQVRKKFNPYATVTVTPRIGNNSRILCLEIELGEDIRHAYFAQRFPSGRYSSDNNDKIRDLQSLLPDIG